MRLFSYCIPIDDGAAPNPFWGICTLTICKPVIRRVANVGDWIAGVGSKDVNGKDYSGRLVYAMKVTDIKSLSEYDTLCRRELPNKIPDVTSKDYKRRVGDCIYDFANEPEGLLRPSVHDEGNRATDLGGENSLLSDHFYYFGIKAIEIPKYLKGIMKQGRWHQSTANDPLLLPFIEWIENAGYRLNELHGDPQRSVEFQNDEKGRYICKIRCESAKKDEIEELQNKPT